MNDALTDKGNKDYEQRLREMNEALLLSSLRQHELTEQAVKDREALAEKQKQLAQSQALLESAVSAGSIATVTWDITRDLMMADERMADIFGIAPENAENLSISEYISAIHPADQPLVRKQLARSIEEDEPFEIEYRVTADGRGLRWVYARGKVERNAAGAAVRFPAALIDITERKKTQQAKSFLASIIDSSRDSIITTDFDTIITSWNYAAELLYGYTAEEALGKPLTMMTLPVDLAEVLTNIDKIRNDGSVEIYDTVRVRKGGQHLHLEVVLSPVRDEADRVIGVSTIVRDITERTRAEDAIIFQAHMLNTVEQAVIATEMDGTITYWNNFASRLYGWTAEETVGRHISEVTTPEPMAEQADKIMSKLRRGQSWSGEFNVRRRDGTIFPAHVTTSPIAGSDGELAGIIGISFDISNRKLAEEELRRSREDLEARVIERTVELAEANKSLESENRQRLSIEKERVEILRRLVTAQEDQRNRIARDLHDQIGQQITALRLKLEMIRSESGEGHPLAEAVDKAREYAEQIDKDASFLAFELRPAGLDDLGLRAAVGNFVREWSRNHGITAEFHTAEIERRRLDPEININVYRIVQEALNNVLKHSQANSVWVMLEFRADNLIFMIEDDGIGFDRFAKFGAEWRGGGLGLTGMQERCQLIGGTMEIESRPGDGTVVVGRVPIGEPSASED